MRSYDFPPDVLRDQTAWYSTYRQLADGAPAASPTEGRRRLLELSARIADHPFWRGPAGTPAARMELKELAQRSVRSATPAVRRAG
ncbi:MULTISPECIES: hypothetical protein [unclassified Streptomyces]|uniref:hypothetical protein n=1 Tax=unclassified Streptomyces TaxID=2593676 RepID=UPI0024A9DC99|nr:MULTISPECIES: hypothetical protein [unclassified Streptomyces]